MKKYTFFLATLMVAMLCLANSCKKDDDDSNDAKYLSATSFASSSWTGTDSEGYQVTLDVTSSSDMTCTYYATTSVSKNTNTQAQKKTVIITYTFDAAAGTFSGTGDDSNNYSGTLTSTSAMNFNMLKGTIAMTKK